MEENRIWQGKPAMPLYLGFFVVCLILGLILMLLHEYLILIPLAFAFWKWLQLRTTIYTLTDQRFFIKRGIFSRRTDEIELYRIKDYVIEEPLWLRLFSLSNIRLKASDKSVNEVEIQAIPRAKEVRDRIRKYVELLRDKKRVREVDFE